MPEKDIVSPDRLLECSFRLGAQVLESGFRPDRIVSIWRGGAPVGLAVGELLALFGIEADPIPIRAQSYTGIDQREEVRVSSLSALVRRVRRGDRLLIVDDIFDTGWTVQEVISELSARAGEETPAEIRVAVPWYKPARNQTAREPDYYLETTDRWLCFPHSLSDLTPSEHRRHRPESWSLIGPAAGARSDRGD
ncbi:MAG: hypoxanthine phosphoribosyltransferase [Proteobacteria bacterium]|nr:hypoxanthine phosphoribosyltransferase [Pseudomonadota bacterium]